jgi:hypothetical protein
VHARAPRRQANAGADRDASDAANVRATPRVPLAPLAPRDPRVPLVFRRGAHAPYATRWFGVTSLAGHARNFASSAIAAEQIDARDWMRPGTPDELLSHIVSVLGGDANAPDLVTALGRPLWIDFVADTGDDHDVSRAVASMIFAEYALPDAAELPRGDILLFGGDTAYPVATGEEIARRLVSPFNEVLRERLTAADPPRVLLGIAGNHDWYDGLDGFGRLFRHRADSDLRDSRAESRPSARRRVPRGTGLVARQLHIDEVTGLVKLAMNAAAAFRAYWAGSKIKRPRRLALVGYEPVQDASYWALPLAPGLEAWGVDRQLGVLDFRQRDFFAQRHPIATRGGVLFVAPDPALAFGERHEPGARMLAACRLSLERHRVFYLTGDVHHYERREVERTTGARAFGAPSGDSTEERHDSLHVIAGGGGAFLHGTRTGPYAVPPACVYPSAAASRRLLSQVPFTLTIGGAGFILHIGFALAAALELEVAARGTGSAVLAGLALSAVITAMLVSSTAPDRPRGVWVPLPWAWPFGAVLGFLPIGLRDALPKLIPSWTGDMGVIVVYAFAGAFAIGLFLALAAAVGFERQQAFSVLSHPGFKHFVRMCVHPDGRIEGWVIGKDDPLGPGPAALIDRLEWPSQGTREG